MTTNPPGTKVLINTGLYLPILSSSVSLHVGDLRIALRSFEDGSFEAKAATARPGSLLNFAIEPPGLSEAAPARLCNRCFVSIIGELVTFLDRMIAVKRSCEKSFSIPSGTTTLSDVQKVVQQILEEEYRVVASDTRLSNPKKLSFFPGLADIARDSALSYFEVRRALEHHSGRATRDVTLWYGRLKLIGGDMELTRPGQAAPENTGISLGMSHDSRLLPAGMDIVIEEHELEHIMFTIQHLVGPEVNRVAGLNSVAVAEGIQPLGTDKDAGAA